MHVKWHENITCKTNYKCTYRIIPAVCCKHMFRNKRIQSGQLVTLLRAPSFQIIEQLVCPQLPHTCTFQPGMYSVTNICHWQTALTTETTTMLHALYPWNKYLQQRLYSRKSHIYFPQYQAKGQGQIYQRQIAWSYSMNVRYTARSVFQLCYTRNKAYLQQSKYKRLSRI